jgi:hypothetical protein
MITVPIPFTRRFFEPEEVIISSCVHCFSTVAESDNEAVLEGLERLHSCNESLEKVSPEDLVASELLAAV